MLQIGKYNNKKERKKENKIFFLAQLIEIGMWKLLVDFYNNSWPVFVMSY